jgi:hypothetical protein
LITEMSAIAEGKQDVQPLAMSYDPTAALDLLDVLDNVCTRQPVGGRLHTLMCSLTKGGKLFAKKPGKISNIADNKLPNNRRDSNFNQNNSASQISRNQSRAFPQFKYATRDSLQKQATRTRVRRAESVNSEIKSRSISDNPHSAG